MNFTRMKTNVEDILNFLFTKENNIFLKVDHMVEISIKNSPKIDVLKVKTFKHPALQFSLHFGTCKLLF